MGVTPIHEAELPLVAMGDPAFWADPHPPLAAAREQASFGRGPDGDDAAVADAHVTPEGRRAGPVDDGGSGDEVVQHAPDSFVLVLLAGPRG